ncbi:HAD family acid phosphatase [Ornithinibacillus salinisoli]|uniref:Nucleotidase n=1 Tax=Ornithinibacillus salinisoli TaxID=1848459 RepID=A0ABW4VYD8_9BACI
MKFGFDIDDTLINLREHAFNLYKQKLNKQLSRDDFLAIKRVEIHEPFGLSDEQGKEMWNSSLEEIYFTDCPAFPGAIETLLELDHQGHDIYYITARPKEHGERTKDWMKEQGFPIQDDHFYYGMKDEEKVHIIQDLDLDFYVDDKPSVLRTLSNTSVNLVVKDQSYNEEVKVARIVDWVDFMTVMNNE